MDLETLYNTSKNFSINKNNSGIITLNARVFAGDTNFSGLDFGSKINFMGVELELNNISTPSGSAFKNYTFTNSRLMQNYDLLIPRTVEWRTIPRNSYEAMEYSLLSTLRIPPAREHDTDIRIKPVDNIYSKNGWDTETIIDEIKDIMSDEYSFFDMVIPPIINYDISEFKVQEGSPLTSVLNSLFPIQGITVTRINNILYVSFPKREIFFLNEFNIPESLCNITSDSEQRERFKYKVVGLPSEPKFVVWESDDLTQEISLSDTDYFGIVGEVNETIEGKTEVGSLSLQLNLMGGLYGVIDRNVTQISEDKWIGMNELLDIINNTGE